MGKQFKQLDDDLVAFIQQQPMFFVATATADSRINLSPKGLDSLRVLSPQRVIWLNYTGSGNETAAHLAEDKRMTIMFNAFKGDPKILRLYGTATIKYTDDAEWEKWIEHFDNPTGARQIIDMQIDLVQTSCGFGVPLMEHVSDRDKLPIWAKNKGDAGIKQYWGIKNTKSLDGKKVYIPQD